MSADIRLAAGEADRQPAGVPVFGADGLIPAIVRERSTRQVLMLAWMNEESFRRTRETGETWFWSRSRKALWNKGATSGNRQRVVAMNVDCDGDALLIDVDAAGPACHTGTVSCFDARSETQGSDPAGPRPAVLPAGAPPSAEGSFSMVDLEQTLLERKRVMPEGSYSASLFKAGRNKILKKIGEEATEVVIAATSEGKERVISEVADLLYHVTALLVNESISFREVEAELARRAAPGVSDR